MEANLDCCHSYQCYETCDSRLGLLLVYHDTVFEILHSKDEFSAFPNTVLLN